MTRLEDRHYSGITFDWVVVRELRFIDNQEQIRRAQLAGLQATLDVQAAVGDDGRSCRTTLRLSLEPPDDEPDLFQKISATIEGRFSVAGEETDIDIGTFARRQAPAILMPFLREAVATATAKSRFGQVLVPPINVAALTEEMERARESKQLTTEG